MASSFSEQIIHILKSLLNDLENSPNWGYIMIMLFILVNVGSTGKSGPKYYQKVSFVILYTLLLLEKL